MGRAARILLCLLSTVTEVSFGRSFFVSPSGRDTNPGTLSQPWQTIGQANGALSAGDTVVVLPGVYSDGINPLRSGSAGAPIVYLASANQQAEIRTGTGIQLTTGNSYVVVGGFRFVSSYRSAEVKGSRGVIIRQCRFFGGNATYECLKFEDLTYSKVQHCYIDRQDPPVNAGNGIDLNGSSSYNVIENDTIIHVSHVAIISAYGGDYHHNVIRNNLLHDNHTHLSPQNGADRYLIENNTVYYSGLVNAGATGKAFQPTCTNSIVRYNVIYADSGNPGNAWRQILAPTVMFSSAEFGVKSMAYNRLYNNLFYGETDEGYPVSAIQLIDNDRDKGTRLEQNRFVNNIIAGGTNYQVMDENGGVSDAEFSHSWAGNLLWSGTPGDVVIYARTANGLHTWSLQQAMSQQPTWWEANNVEGDPLFANTIGQGPAKDFTLQEGSAAIDAGVHLTVAMESGAGSRTLRVDDAQYFMDGWGIIEPDSLLIEGTSGPVGAAVVNYATGTITLQSARTWAAGARVWYYRSDRVKGNAPDIGPLESPYLKVSKGGNLSTPSVVSPATAGNVVPTNPTLVWGGCRNARYYQIQVSLSELFESSVVNRSGIADTSWKLTGLNGARQYAWRVRGVNGPEVSSWSPAGKFTTTGSGTSVNVVTNADFEQGGGSWSFYTSGAGTFNVETGYQGTKSCHISIAQAGTNIQLYQSGVTLEPSSIYQLTFHGYCSTGNNLSLSVFQHGSPYAGYGLDGYHVDLASQWQPYSVQFATPPSGGSLADARVQFWLGSYAIAGDEYWLDNVSLLRIGSTGVEEVQSVPTTLRLEQNYPNPFNPSTTIRYSLPGTMKVTLVVYDLLGREVGRLFDGEQTAGQHQVSFEGDRLAGGIYMCRLAAEGYSETKRMVLVK
jgi:hypothetical protein